MDTPDIPVENTTTSLSNPAGNSCQLSEQGVVALSLMKAGTQSSENSEQVLVLMSILFGITENVLNPDIFALSLYRARDMCDHFGVDPEVFEDVVKRYLAFANKSHAKNPLSSLF